MTAQVGPFIVRDFNPWDAPRLFVLTGDPDVTKYLGFRTHKSEQDAVQLLAQYAASPSRWQAICTPEEPADILGVVGVEVKRHQATLTLMFRHDRKTRGAGRRFAVPFVQWIFTHPQIWRVWSYVHVDNVAGRRVTERTGAQCEGVLRRFEYFPNINTEEPQDCCMYSIVRQNANIPPMPLNIEPIPAPFC